MNTKTNAQRTPLVQLEIAAQWLNEAAASTYNQELKKRFERVARDCLQVAGVEAAA